jgi:hypothetical protein
MRCGIKQHLNTGGPGGGTPLLLVAFDLLTYHDMRLITHGTAKRSQRQCLFTPSAGWPLYSGNIS